MGNFKKLAQKRLFLPVFSMILVMLINVVYDIATGCLLYTSDAADE